MHISSHIAAVVRQAALLEKKVQRSTLMSVMESEPLDEDADLFSFGPHFGAEAAEELMRRLEGLGLAFYDDFFLFEGSFPAWCSFSGSLASEGAKSDSPHPGTVSAMGRTKLNLVVIYSRDVERSRDFYSALGVELTPEKHGGGPAHYSCDVQGTVLEIYPRGRRRSSGGLRLGLRVPVSRSAVESLVQQGLLENMPTFRRGPSGAEVCVLDDPDDNQIELEMSVQ